MAGGGVVVSRADDMALRAAHRVLASRLRELDVFDDVVAEMLEFAPRTSIDALADAWSRVRLDAARAAERHARVHEGLVAGPDPKALALVACQRRGGEVSTSQVYDDVEQLGYRSPFWTREICRRALLDLVAERALKRRKVFGVSGPYQWRWRVA